MLYVKRIFLPKHLDDSAQMWDGEHGPGHIAASGSRGVWMIIRFARLWKAKEKLGLSSQLSSHQELMRAFHRAFFRADAPS